MELTIDQRVFKRGVTSEVTEARVNDLVNWEKRNTLPGAYLENYLDKPGGKHRRRCFLELVGLRTMAMAIHYLNLSASDACFLGEIAMFRATEAFSKSWPPNLDMEKETLGHFGEGGQLTIIPDWLSSVHGAYRSLPFLGLQIDKIIMFTWDDLADAVGEQVVFTRYSGDLPTDAYQAWQRPAFGEASVDGESGAQGVAKAIQIGIDRNVAILQRYEANFEKENREPTEWEATRCGVLQELIEGDQRRLKMTMGEAE